MHQRPGAPRSPAWRPRRSSWRSRQRAPRCACGSAGLLPSGADLPLAPSHRVNAHVDKSLPAVAGGDVSRLASRSVNEDSAQSLTGSLTEGRGSALTRSPGGIRTPDLPNYEDTASSMAGCSTISSALTLAADRAGPVPGRWRGRVEYSRPCG